MQDKRRVSQRYQKGFVGYIYFMLAMLSIVALSYSQITRSAAVSQHNYDSRQSIINQYQIIRSRIISCAIQYPGGNNGTGFHIQYPATPTGNLVSNLTCPGQSGSNNLWTGTGGSQLPLVPPEFNNWTYVNDATSIRISLTAKIGTTDLGAMGMINWLANRLGSSASIVGPTLTIVIMT